MQSNNDYKKELSFNLSTNKLTLALSALFVMIILGTIFLLNSKSVAGNSPTVSPTPALGLSTSGNTPQSQTGVAGASTTREQYGPQEPTSSTSIIPTFSPSPQKLSPTTSTSSEPTPIQSEPTATSVPTHSPTPTPTQTMIPTSTPTSTPSPILTPTKMPDDTPTLIPTGL